MLRWKAALATPLVLMSVAAGAQERPVRIDGADGCVDEAALTARLLHWLGSEVLPPGVEVEVSVGESPAAAYVLQRRGHPTVRRAFPTLDGPCPQRVDALALALAIALDPEAVSRAANRSAAPPEAPAPGAPTALAEGESRDDLERSEMGAETLPIATSELGEVTAGDTEEPPARIRLSVGLGVGLAWRWLERPAAFLALSLEARLHPAVALRAAFALTSRPRSSLGSAEYEARLAVGELGASAGASVGRVRLDGSVAVLAGSMIARGRGYASDLRVRRPWVALAVGPRVELGLGEMWALGAHVEGVVALLAASVHVMDSSGTRGGQATTPPLGLRAGVEARAKF